MHITRISNIGFKSSLSLALNHTNPFLNSSQDHFELSQNGKKLNELKSLLPKKAKVDEKELKKMAQYENEDYTFAKGIVPYINDEGEFDFDDIDKKTAQELGKIEVQCPQLKEIQKELLDD